MKNHAIWWLAGGFGIFLFFCMGIDLPFVLVGFLLFGWIGFLWNALPNVTVSVPMAVYGIVTCAALVVGSHWFLRWLYQSIAQPAVVDSTTPEMTPPKSRQWRFRWTVQTVGLVLLMFVAGISIVGVAHQVAWIANAKEPLFAFSSEQHTQFHSRQNLKAQGLAFHNHHDLYKSFASGFTADSNGRALHSWQTQVLPYLEDRVDTYSIVPDRRFDRKLPWNSPTNAPYAKLEVGEFLNPAVQGDKFTDENGYPLSHYAGNNRVLGSTHAFKFKEITDGAGKTLLAGEAAGNFVARAKPTRGRNVQLGLNKSPEGFGSDRRSGVTMMLLADGAVRSLTDDIDPSVLEAIATPAGGDDVSAAFAP